MRKAWIENNVIRDIAYAGPYSIYHADVAVFYNTDVPDSAENGDTFANGVLTKRPVPVVVTPDPQPVQVIPPIVSVIEWKMLFTSTERIAAKTSTDPIIQDLQELMNDPRTTNVNLALQSINNALDYMTTIGILAEGRKAEILTGVVR